MRPGDGGCIPGMTLLHLQAAEDDCEIDSYQTPGNSVFYADGEKPQPPEPQGIYIGYWNGAPTFGIFRFQAGAILGGVNVGKVVLSLWGSHRMDGWDNAKHALTISIENSADPTPVTSELDDPMKSKKRTLLGAVRWPPSGGLTWNVNAYNRSPDLRSLIKMLIATQGGLKAKAHVQFWVRGAFSSGVAEVTTPAFGTPGYIPASLQMARCD